jgi:hypothetical protein
MSRLKLRNARRSLGEQGTGILPPVGEMSLPCRPPIRYCHPSRTKSRTEEAMFLSVLYFCAVLHVLLQPPVQSRLPGRNGSLLFAYGFTGAVLRRSGLSGCCERVLCNHSAGAAGRRALNASGCGRGHRGTGRRIGLSHGNSLSKFAEALPGLATRIER